MPRDDQRSENEEVSIGWRPIGDPRLLRVAERMRNIHARRRSVASAASGKQPTTRDVFQNSRIRRSRRSRGARAPGLSSEGNEFQIVSARRRQRSRARGGARARSPRRQTMAARSTCPRKRRGRARATPVGMNTKAPRASTRAHRALLPRTTTHSGRALRGLVLIDDRDSSQAGLRVPSVLFTPPTRRARACP